MGSASELDYHLLLAHDLSFLATPDHIRLANDVSEVKRMLGALITRMRSVNHTVRDGQLDYILALETGVDS